MAFLQTLSNLATGAKSALTTGANYISSQLSKPLSQGGTTLTKLVDLASPGGVMAAASNAAVKAVAPVIQKAVTPAPAMSFPVGQGITPAQTAVAQQTVAPKLPSTMASKADLTQAQQATPGPGVAQDAYGKRVAQAIFPQTSQMMDSASRGGVGQKLASVASFVPSVIKEAVVQFPARTTAAMGLSAGGATGTAQPKTFLERQLLGDEAVSPMDKTLSDATQLADSLAKKVIANSGQDPNSFGGKIARLGMVAPAALLAGGLEALNFDFGLGEAGNRAVGKAIGEAEKKAGRLLTNVEREAILREVTQKVEKGVIESVPPPPPPPGSPMERAIESISTELPKELPKTETPNVSRETPGGKLVKPEPKSLPPISETQPVITAPRERAKSEITRLADEEAKGANLVGEVIRPPEDTTSLADLRKTAKAQAKAQDAFLADLEKSTQQAYEDALKGQQPALKRKDIVTLMNEGTDPATIMKVRSLGDGSVRVSADAFEVLRSIPDIKEQGLFTPSIYTFDELGQPVKDLFWNPIVKAEGAVSKARAAAEAELKVVKQGLSKSSSERIMLHAMSQESDGAKILKNLGKSAPTLTPGEQKAYGFMRDRYDELLGQLNKVRAMVGAEPIAKRSNYFTHIADLNALAEAGVDIGKEKDLGAAMRANIHRIQTPFSFARERTGTSKVVLDAFAAFEKYQSDAIKYATMTPTAAQLRLLLSDIKLPDGSVFSLAKENPNAYNMLSDWLDYTMGARPKITDTATNKAIKATEQVLAPILKHIQVATLAGNLGSAVAQTTAIRGTILEIGWKQTAKGIGTLAEKGFKEAAEKSNVLFGRIFDASFHDVGVTARGGVMGALAKVDGMISETGKKVISATLGKLDYTVATATWYGAYDKALAEGLSEGRAAIYADDVVIRTQGSGSRSAISPSQRTTIGKALTMFQTFVINDLKLLEQKIPGAWKKGDKKGAMIALINTLGISAAFNYAYTSAGFQAPFPEVYTKTKQGYESGGVGGAALGAAKEIGGMLPVVGGPMKFGQSDVKKTLPVVGDIVKLQEAVSQGNKANIAFQMGKLLGIPGMSQAKKTYEGIKAMSKPMTVYGGASGKRKAEVLITSLPDKIKAVMSGPYGTSVVKDKVELLNKQGGILDPIASETSDIKDTFSQAFNAKDKEGMKSAIASMKAHNEKTVKDIVAGMKSGIFKDKKLDDMVTAIKANTLTMDDLVASVKKDMTAKIKAKGL